jgi:hypothetical protein
MVIRAGCAATAGAEVGGNVVGWPVSGTCSPGGNSESPDGTVPDGSGLALGDAAAVPPVRPTWRAETTP